MLQCTENKNHGACTCHVHAVLARVSRPRGGGSTIDFLIFEREWLKGNSVKLKIHGSGLHEGQLTRSSTAYH